MHSIGRDHHLHRYDLLCCSNDIEEADCSLNTRTNPKSTILKNGDAAVLCHILIDTICLASVMILKKQILKTRRNPKSTILKTNDAVLLCHILNASRGFENIVKSWNQSFVQVERLLGLPRDGEQMTFKC